MGVSAVFIHRPVMTSLLMIALVIFGAFGYSQLPVSELPNVDFPTISVTTKLPGADPETMASGSAPGSFAVTEMVGKSTLGSSLTGSCE